MSATPISHKQAAALGWVRVDAKPWTKLRAQWRHRDGWTLEHCGHPTALTPWALYDPKGRMHLTGATGSAANPTFGSAFGDLRDPMIYVARNGTAAIARMDEIARRSPSAVRRVAA